jgi:hypothetical protein
VCKLDSQDPRWLATPHNLSSIAESLYVACRLYGRSPELRQPCAW